MPDGDSLSEARERTIGSIGGLGDAEAIRVLGRVCRGQTHGESVEPTSVAEIAALWREAVGDVGDGRKPTEGELARATLAWLASDPGQRQAIAALVAAPAPRQYDGLSVGALVAVLLLLKTKGAVEYKDGKWRLKLELVELKQGPLKTVFDLFAKLASGNRGTGV